ncbi:MFS transporter [Candidatus Lokiarchaeum ossiferum]|uniref:MFS transporter n=1 Tax=Candidatus Lokiarchaeum ossiferum TaxID=2951803 RepID=UPI00352D598D
MSNSKKTHIRNENRDNSLINTEMQKNPIKKAWPALVSQLLIAINISIFFFNSLVISTLIWPGEPFHSQEMGFFLGIGTWVIAFVGLAYGKLTDQISRKKLFVFTNFLLGISFIGFSVIPTGLGNLTFVLFFICNIINAVARGGNVPLINSYTNDVIEEGEKSHYFGLSDAFYQLFQISGLLIGALVFQFSIWRIYFLIYGIVGILLGVLIAIKAKEPKRGMLKEELKETLNNNDAVYDYTLTKDMVKQTIIRPTNIIAFFEGIFTTLLLGIPDFLMIAFFQSPPYNMAPFSMALFMIIFGLPGGVLGGLTFGKLSDKIGKKDIRCRIIMISLSILVFFVLYLVIFNSTYQPMTPEQGSNIGYLLSNPTMIFLGILAFFARFSQGIYNMNQPPILQKINLPEAQGQVSSWNLMLEAIGSGAAPILGGILLVLFDMNYQKTVNLTMSIGAIGAFCWILGLVWVRKDVERVSNILKDRAEEMNQNISEN